MILIDLVSSINSALPQLADSPSRCAIGDDTFGPRIGYAFFRPAACGSIERFAVRRADEMWQGLRSATVGILGEGAPAEAVAGSARRAFATDAVCHYRAPAADADGDPAGRSETFRRVLDAEVLCVALPWSAALWTQVQCHRFEPINARVVQVVWRRSPAIERALVYLGRHYVEPIQLRSLAQVACVSKFHLVRMFSATLGITPHRYQLLLRLARAKAMLREGGCITRIAHGVGFADHSHLDRSFRVLTGMTPSEYQRSVAAG